MIEVEKKEKNKKWYTPCQSLKNAQVKLDGKKREDLYMLYLLQL